MTRRLKLPSYEQLIWDLNGYNFDYANDICRYSCKDDDFLLAKPFLKWAGGKRQLSQLLVDFFPPEMHNEETSKYGKPFN
jgi:hypothetical protein